ncbi:MAG: hypothetical protein COA54_14850 [Thiotrichaceae bacterium]|nr:MAG: hypothetical protein COA54_14850 [Thiotrichaceae bacterium]
MAHFKKISSTLSIAATVLLEACSSSGGGSSAPDAEANTTAPFLIGNWQTACTITTQGTSTTTTGASGSGGSSVTGGKAFIANASFTQNGHVDLSAEFFSSTDCNTNTSSGTNNFEGVYFIGNASLANDGSDVTGIDLSDTESTTFSIFQIVNGVSLFLGIESESSTGNNGSNQSTRHDGLGERYSKM